MTPQRLTSASPGSSSPVSPPRSQTTAKASPASDRRRTALLVSVLIGFLALFALLAWALRTSRPPTHATSSLQTSSGPAAGGQNPTGSPSPGSALPGPASRVSATAGPAPVQVYWRFATHEYLINHRQVKKNTIHIPDGYSASFIRVDLENNTEQPIAITPDMFILYSGPNGVAPSLQNLPGLFEGAKVPSHSGVQGWLLFVKPWWDRGPDAAVSRLDLEGVPGARVKLSARQAPASEVPPSGGPMPTGMTPRTGPLAPKPAPPAGADLSSGILVQSPGNQKSASPAAAEAIRRVKLPGGSVAEEVVAPASGT